MKLNDIRVTFWFNKVVDIKNKLEIFESELKDFFHGINSVGVPADINPEYPRITAVSDGGHTRLNVSMINFQLFTNFDDNFNHDFSKCFEYVENRVLKLFEVLTENLKLKVLYGAIMTTCEVEHDNAVNLVKDNLLSKNVVRDFCDAGVSTSEVINEKFFCNVVIHSAKLITITKKWILIKQILFSH